MLSKNLPAKDTAIRKLIAESGIELPDDYISFLKLSNGGVLDVESGWYQIYPAEEVIEVNRNLHVEEFIPGFFVFGGDGGNELLAFDTRESKPWRVYMVPMVAINEEDAVMLAGSFKSFIEAERSESGAA